MKLSDASAWQSDQISRYLQQSIMPMRLATQGSQFPGLCSVWFVYDAEQSCLLAASHENSQLVRALQRDPHAAFEIAPNEAPYHGVRGRAVVELERENVEQTLNTLIDRYLGDSNSGLANWLLGRVDEEYVLRIKPVWITAWDYAERMEKVPG